MVFYDPTRTRRFYVGLILATSILVPVASVAYALFYLKQDASTYARAPEGRQYNENLEKTIALTFDDGPNPEYTPSLVALLEEEGVPATFFLVGEQVLRNPDLARMLVEKGFEIGNHSFSHSQEVHDSPERIRQELTATDHAIVSATGRSTILYRPPFLLDVGFGIVDGSRVPNEKLREIERIGPMVVSADIDTTDWEQESINDAGEIYDILVSGVKDGKHVVLLHDHGGKGATIEALKHFIPAMKEAGYTFVPISHFFGLTREEVMPEFTMGPWDRALSQLLTVTTNAGPIFFLLGTIVGVAGLLRMWLIFTSFRFFVSRRSSNLPHTLKTGEIENFSVIIPAYNEAANIGATLRSVMSGSCFPSQVIVVDDGSTDRTAQTVRDFMDGVDGARVLLVQKENGGNKAGALRYGMGYATKEIVVCIDADTIIAPRAFEYLLEHFEDSSVGAVAGKMYPATTKTLLEKLQYLEYIQGQNLDKKVLALGNSVGIVPGAIGAWRKRAIEESGGYSTDTVVEDQDLTLALLAAGWKVNFEPHAIALTETPNTVQTFLAQRFRWMYGTLQCFYKYDQWLFSTTRPWLGFVVIPNTIFFSIMTPLIAPFFDAVAIAGILGFVQVPLIITIFCLLLILDLWFAFEAIRHEKVPRYSWLPLVIVGRFFYQYVNAFMVAKSILAAVGGSMVKWGQLTRRGAAAEALPALETTLGATALSEAPEISLGSSRVVA